MEVLTLVAFILCMSILVLFLNSPINAVLEASVELVCHCIDQWEVQCLEYKAKHGSLKAAWKELLAVGVVIASFVGAFILDRWR